MNSRRAPIITGAVAALVVAIAMFLLVLPKMGQVSETQGRLQEAQDEEISLDAQVRALEEAQAAAPETEAQIAAIEEQVPPTADLPALFRLLQGAADQAAVDFFSFTPGSPTPDVTASYSMISSAIQVKGSYFSIDEYLFLLETLPRAAKVTSISLTPATVEGAPATSVGSLQLSLTVEFYTTDSSAGPGSIPGPTSGAVTEPGA